MPNQIDIVDAFHNKYSDDIFDLYEDIEKKCHTVSNILNCAQYNNNIKGDFLDFILYSIKSDCIIKK